MKTISKKLASVVLALCLCFSLVGTALAASSGDSEFTITVTNAYEGETYTAYKVFDVTYDDDDHFAYTIESTSPWFEFISTYGTDVYVLTPTANGTTYIVTAAEGADEDAVAEVFANVTEEFLSSLDAAASEEANDSGSVTLDVSSSGAGYYFVTTTMGSLVTVDTTSPSVEVTDKNVPPTVSKGVRDESHEEEGSSDSDFEDKDEADVGDVLEFEITIENAAHLSSLCLHDYVTGGISFNGDKTIHIYLNEISEGTELEAEDHYSIFDGATCDYGCIFEITFNPTWLDSLSDTDVIIVTYEGTVTEEAVTQNYNDAILQYGTASWSLPAQTETDVFGFGLEKTDGTERIDGAVFTLTEVEKDSDFVDEDTVNSLLYFVVDSDGRYVVAEKGASEEGATSDITVKDGYVDIFGLEAGTYTLTETTAPDGYNKLTYDITVTISDKGEVSINVGDNNGTSITDDGVITVVNNSGSILPGTGGMGTTIFYIIGGVLVAGAVVVLITRRRMSSNEG